MTKTAKYEYRRLVTRNLDGLSAEITAASNDGWRLVSTNVVPPLYIAFVERERGDDVLLG